MLQLVWHIARHPNTCQAAEKPAVLSKDEPLEASYWKTVTTGLPAGSKLQIMPSPAGFPIGIVP